MIQSIFCRKITLAYLRPKIKSIYILHNCKTNTNCTSVIHFQYSLLCTNMIKNVPYIPNKILCSLSFDQKRFYTNIDRKNLSYKLVKSKQFLTDKIELKRLRMRERKDILVQGIRDKKSKVQEKVREMEEIVERENIFTIPNFLCVARSCLSPYIGYIIIHEQYQLAIGLLIFAGLTDLLDGFIARNWVSQASKIGSFLDPMADKLLVGSLVISLSWCNLFPAWLCGMIIFRDVFLIIAACVIRYISLPPPKTLTRYFDATHVTAKLKPTLISKINTAVQLTTIAASLAAPVYGLLAHSTLVGMWYFTGITTAAAATSYVFSKDTYQLIRNRKNIKTS